MGRNSIGHITIYDLHPKFNLVDLNFNERMYKVFFMNVQHRLHCTEHFILRDTPHIMKLKNFLTDFLIKALDFKYLRDDSLSVLIFTQSIHIVSMLVDHTFVC